MPIFQDDLGGGRGTPPTKPKLSPPLESQLDRNTFTRRVSEESIRTELCEGLLLDYPENNGCSPPGEPQTGFAFPVHGTSDRIELMQRLKKGQSPTWLPNRNVSHIKSALTASCNLTCCIARIFPSRLRPKDTPQIPAPCLAHVTTTSLSRNT